MSVIVTIKLAVRPDRMGELIDLFNRKALPSRNFQGCEAFEIYGDEAEPGRVMIYQKWRSRRHHEWYFSSRAESEILEAVAPYLTEQPEVRFHDRLEA